MSFDASPTFFLHNGTVSPVEGWAGAFDCPTDSGLEAAAAGFSFKHKFNKNNIQMFGSIKSKSTGTQVSPCGAVEPSMGPLLVEGVIVFPK